MSLLGLNRLTSLRALAAQRMLQAGLGLKRLWQSLQSPQNLFANYRYLRKQCSRLLCGLVRLNRRRTIQSLEINYQVSKAFDGNRVSPFIG